MKERPILFNGAMVRAITWMQKMFYLQPYSLSRAFGRCSTDKIHGMQTHSFGLSSSSEFYMTINTKFDPGETALLAFAKGIEVTIVSFTVYTMGIQYECVWWQNGQRFSQFLNEFELIKKATK